MNQQIRTADEAEEVIWPTAHQCKWIDGDPKRSGEWSCCLETVETIGDQYCAAHLERVYTPSKPR